MTDTPRKTVVDLFCGCGGMSSGAQRAGFEVVAGVDIEKKYIASFSRNFPNAHSITDDITKIAPAEFSGRIGLEEGELDLLMGGPPCQGFSKNVPRKHRYLEDPKNLLVKTFLDYSEHLRPRFIIMENVAEMKNGFGGQYTDEVLDRLHGAGYSVTHSVLNAADYGVPQRRRRAFFLARLGSERPEVPQETHVPRSANGSLVPVDQHVSVWEAVGDLPALEHGEGSEITPYATDAFTEYQRQMRSPSGVVRNHFTRFLQPTQHARLAALAPGQGHKDLPRHLQVKSGYSGAYGRLTKDMIAPTITRWVFHPGSGRWGHPVDTRVLSIREVARIQGFWDDFEFVGTYTQQAGQLGNAVPPLLAYKVVQSLTGEPQIASSSSIRRSREMRSASVGNLKLTA